MIEDAYAVIPAYNCAPTIGDVVAGCLDQVRGVWVVDDGSHDDTAEAARAAGATVEQLPTNCGKGAALSRGLELALDEGIEAVVTLDGDGQHDTNDIPGLVAHWQAGADLVVGSRLECPAGEPPSAMPKCRYWTNYLGTRVLSWMTGWDLHDSQSGFRVLSASLARRLDLTARGYAVESEMLLKAAKLGASFAHAPIRTIYASEVSSHYQPVRDTARICIAAVYFQVFDDR